MPHYWGKVGAGLLVFDRETCKVLVQHRSADVNEPNTWGIVGGAVSANRPEYGIGEQFKDIGVPEEDIRRAAVEEFKEETGFDGDVKIVSKFYKFEAPGFEYHSYVAFVNRKFDPKNTWESQGYEWMDIDDLLNCASKQCDKDLHPAFAQTLRIDSVKQDLMSACRGLG